MKIQRLMIANRGEILRRIAITAQTMGISTVTIWQDDTPPPRVLTEVIDQFIYVKTETNAYLDQELILNAAIESKCDAIHPGFGFLSENAGFARSCLDRGLLWVGPHPESMLAMASKDTSRTIAIESGVPVNQALEGFVPRDDGSDLARVEAFAKQVGFPLLVKAALGGGGKGMRLVEAMDQLSEGIRRGHSEALSSFGDGTLLIERYITSPRHIEVQVFGDKHGNIFAIGDRDCSLQRRHQKIIEEAPAPNLDDRTRSAMHKAAVALAKAVKYDSAGTVEFLVDASAKGDQPFYFLEMNTRLQVEHPVTEEVFGIDLVAWQLRVAAGESLPDWTDLRSKGWAVEARIYAEDCRSNFLPSPGPIYDFRPGIGPGIRWETGIDRCDRVFEQYDPMIAKAVAFGQTRDEAFRKLAYALKRTALFGIVTNIDYLITLLENSDFLQGAVTTHFLKDQSETIQSQWDGRINDSANYMEKAREATDLYLTGTSVDSSSIRSIVDLKRESIFQEQKLEKQAYDSSSQMSLIETYKGHGGTILSGQLWIQGTTISFCIFRGLNKTERWFNVNGVVVKEVITKASLNQYENDQTGQGDLIAPVPGKVVSINAKAGESLKSGDVVLVLESMKLEFEVKAERDGEVAQVHVAPGAQVSAGDTLVSWHVD